MAYNVSDGYKSVIYSGDAKHKLKLLFNGVELEDADVFCESLKVTSRILPNGSTRFSLDNFIAKEAEIILHDIDTTIIQSPVNISIGTLVDGTYEYVPIGLFVVQDLPTTDKNKTTIKLRDYAVKFDFGYNAKPLIDENGGSATKLQILQDICNKAGVETDIIDFLGWGDAVGIYDNSITARTYISYLAEQAGAIVTIDRSGKLIFVYLEDLETVEIPLEIVEKYEDGEKYEISRVVYEDAIRKFEAGEETKDTLFLNTANPYIESQTQIESILELNKDIPINSFKTGKIIGNPAIDAYDIIKIEEKETKTIEWDGDTTGRENYMEMLFKVSNLTPSKEDLIGQKAKNNRNGIITEYTIEEDIIHDIEDDEGNTGNILFSAFGYVIYKPVVLLGQNLSPGIYFISFDGEYATQLTFNNIISSYKTLATNDLTYNGVMINTFDTQIGKEAKKENVTLTPEATFKKWAKTEIDNVEAEVRINTGKIETVADEMGNMYTKGQVNELIQNAETGVTNTFSEAGGNNILRNTGLWFENSDNSSTGEIIETIEWDGDITGRESIAGVYYKVSNLIPTKEELIGQIFKVFNAGEIEENIIEESNLSSMPDDNGNEENILACGMAFVVVKNSASVAGEMRTSGIYFVRADSDFYGTQLTYKTTGTINPYEFWVGVAKKGDNDNATNYRSILLQNSSFIQEPVVPNGNYSISFYYRKLISNAVASVVINDKEYPLDSLETKQFYTGEQDSETGEYIVDPIVVSNNYIKIEFKCDASNGVEVYDLMCNKGSVKLAYSQNQNETTTSTVNISRGITITSSDDKNTKFKADYDGIRILDGTNTPKTTFTDKGTETDELLVRRKATITGLLHQEVDDQTWVTKI